jgi:hypothetical protein
LPRSFADAEVPEDNIQDVLDVDSPRQPAEGMGCGAQFLGQQIFRPTLAFSAAQGREGLFQGKSVAGAAHQQLLRSSEGRLNILMKLTKQSIKALAGRRRNIEYQITFIV